MVLTREIHVWMVWSWLPCMDYPVRFHLWRSATYSTCFPRLYPCSTYLKSLSPHSQNHYSFYTCLHGIPPLPLTVCVSGCECQTSRLTCHALKWISCGIFLLRSVFGKKKRQVKQGRCPDQASVNPKQASGKGADDREKFHLNIYGYEED